MRRFEDLRERPHHSVFGPSRLSQAVYGTREGRKIDWACLNRSITRSGCTKKWPNPLCRSSKPIPPKDEEGAILVTSADAKGVPMRREKDAPAILDHDRQQGPKPGRKKQAVVGAICTIDPHLRTPKDIVEAL